MMMISVSGLAPARRRRLPYCALIAPVLRPYCALTAPLLRLLSPAVSVSPRPIRARRRRGCACARARRTRPHEPVPGPFCALDALIPRPDRIHCALIAPCSLPLRPCSARIALLRQVPDHLLPDAAADHRALIAPC